MIQLQEANKRIESYAKDKEVYLYIGLFDSTLYIKEEELDMEDCFSYANHKNHYTRNDINSIMIVLEIKTIVFEDGESFPTEKLAKINKPYAMFINSAKIYELKKMIFFARRTKQVRFINAIAKSDIIVYAKPNGTKLEFYKNDFDGKTLIPVFSDTDELNAFYDNADIDTKNVLKTFKPLITTSKMIIGEILKHKDEDGIYINPASFPIVGKDFSMIFRKELIDFMRQQKSKL